MVPAAPTLRLVLFGVVVLAAAAVGLVTSNRGPAADLTFDQPLAHYGAEKPKIRKLPDGGRIAVGSRTGHDVTVQWSGPHATSWSAPQEVQQRPKQWTHDISVRQSDGTIAITPDFWSQRMLDDDYAPKLTTLTVCRDYWCDGSRDADWLTSAVIADSGALVAFPTDERHVLFWEAGRGYRSSVVHGMPTGDRRLRMLSDGTLVGVIGRWDGEQCHYVLHTADRRSTSFHRELESAGFYDSKPCLLASVDVAGDDTVDVWVESLRDNITFRRHGSAWAVDQRMLARMQIPDTDGASTLAPAEVNVGSDQTALIGSRDRRAILLQTRAGPRKPWSRARVIAHAPTGTVCRNIGSAEGRGRTPLTMVLVHCYRDNRRVKSVDAPSDVALVLATTDGRQWATETVDRPQWEPLSSTKALMAVGAKVSLLYRGGPTFTTVQLPSDRAWDGLALSPDGRQLVRIPGNGNPAVQCVPTWTVAPITATAWPPPTRFTADGFPRTGTCSGSIYADGGPTFTAGVYQSDWSWEGGMQLRNSRLEVMPPPD